MWALRPSLLFFLVSQAGRPGFGFSQPARPVFKCESAESCIGPEVQSISAWNLWLCVSLALAMLLLCTVACCLHCWLKRRRLSSSSPSRTLAVFALSDTHPAYEGEAAKIHPHFQIPEQGSSDAGFAVVLGSGPPPAYKEAAMQEGCRALRTTRGTVIPPDLHL
uniref:Transmembrane protein 207 isoform X2 n=1 Tax=Pogona vitticeps TaxID=103695 RepID=A0ABM5FVB5_9SAUR